MFHIRLTRRLTLAAVAAYLSLAARRAAAAASYNIVADTYIDSEYVTETDSGTGQTTVILNNAHTNYGHSQAVKVVTSFSSGNNPDPSNVRALFALPDQFWTDLGTAPVASARVYYAAKTTTGYSGTRAIELHPLTTKFTPGTGGNGSSTTAGAANTPANPVGADWYTSDGATAWNTPGGDYAAANVNATVRAGPAGITGFTWDIASLLNDSIDRALIHANGLLMKLDVEDYPNPQDFASLYSADGAAFKADATLQPTVTFTAVPEPATGTVAVVAATALLGRRRRYGK